MIGFAEDKFLPLPYLSPHKNLFPLLQVRTLCAFEEFLERIRKARGAESFK
jgi:hypothetical protein